jgi:hypothetical protein
MEAEASRKSGASLREAMDFLSNRLAAGPVLKSEIEEEAEANCISGATLRRAQKKLSVKARKERGRVDGRWFWELPTPDKRPSQEIKATQAKVVSTGEGAQVRILSILSTFEGARVKENSFYTS